MANNFADSFSRVFIADVPSNTVPHQVSHKTSSLPLIDFDNVCKVLLSLDPNSSVGGDGVHPRLLKSLADVLSVPLAIIFLNSLLFLPFE